MPGDGADAFDGAAVPRWPLGLPTRLRPVELLSVGRTSAVWSVRDSGVGADRVVKVLAPSDDWRIDPADRVETEARALARLADLDGVVALREAGRTDSGVGWLVYDRIDGETLDRLAPLSWSELSSIGFDLARTLAGAHERQVHHGDVSPSNVLVEASGRCWLADFGVAGLGPGHDDPGGLTPAFAAPERLRGALPSAASDVFSLCRTLEHVCVGPAPDHVRSALAAGLDEHPGRRPTALGLAGSLGQRAG